MLQSRRDRRTHRAAAGAWLILGSLATHAHAQVAVRNQGYIPFSEPPINYRSSDLHDPVSKLQQRLAGGEDTLEYEPEHGYLRSVLRLLAIPVSSQTLVFSKTSFQYPKISPEHPRALYFNDDVYVGSVHEGKAIEIISFDPLQGAIFYLLDERRTEHPVLQRAELDCTQCHIAAATRGIPGVFLRSIYPTSRGTLAFTNRSYITDQQSPFSQRWGGWYVTGDAGIGAHLGNTTVDDAQPSSTVNADDAAVKLSALGRRFDPSAYLFAGNSDVVAHLVLAHQTQMHNLITLTNYKTRLGQPFEPPAEQLLRYLLFVKETPLAVANGARIGADSAFAREFAARGPRDSHGRSLRDLDLRTRLFRYPCSYLIYSDSFDALPEPAKGYVYHRLLEILSGHDQSPDFAGLSSQDKRTLLEILLATKTALPAEWREYASAQHIRAHEH